MKKLLLLLTLLPLISCQGIKEKFKGENTESPTEVLAEVNGDKITNQDLQPLIASQLLQFQTQLYDLKKQAVDSLIEDKLLNKEASKQGVSVQDLLKNQVSDKVGTVSDEEAKVLYEKAKDRVGGKSFDEVKEIIKKQVQQQKTLLAAQSYVDQLKSNSQVKIFLTPPKIDVGVDNDPFKGNKDAKVTMIEFTDYQCPYCSRAHPTVQELIKEYGDKIHYVLRDFPLEFHDKAPKAAEAVNCAGEQGKYWEYSDILWENQQALDVADLKKYAGQLNLDTKQFDNCLDSSKFANEVQKDQADGAKAGVTGTPTFFINGEMITGARPIEQFKEVIDRKLKESGS